MSIIQDCLFTVNHEIPTGNAPGCKIRVMVTFPHWLIDQLRERDWSQADFARRSGVARATISRILSGQRQPGVDFCNSAAHALGIEPSVVFEQAGLLQPDNLPADVYNAAELYLIHLYRQAPDLLRSAAIAVLRITEE